MMLYPTDNLDVTAKFMSETLGMKLLFRDGARFCLFENGDFTVGLLGEEERIIDSPAITFATDDIEAEVERYVQCGANLVSPISTGPHEKRAVIRMPGSGSIVVSQKLL